MFSVEYSLLSAFLFVCVYLLYRRWQSYQQWLDTINRIPGPKEGAILGSVFQLKGGSERFHHFLDLAKTYKGLFRLRIASQAFVMVAKPDALEVVLGSSKFINKSFAYRFLLPWLGEGLLASTGEKWKTRRKLITPTFHFKILNDFVRVFVEEAIGLVSQLERSHGDEEPFDIFPYLTRYTLDTICRTAMGKSVHEQADEGSSYVKACVRMSELLQNRVWYPWLWPTWLYNLLPPGREHKKCIDTLHGFTNRIIEERLSEPEVATTDAPSPTGRRKKRLLAFLDLLIDAYKNGKISKEGIREEVDTFLFRGHDTTASGLCWTLFLLGTHSDVQEKVAEEVKQLFDTCLQEDITTEELKSMSYFDCVIKESLRLYPPVPLFSRKTVEDIYLDGHFIPKGMTITMCPTALHWNPDVWPEPRKFDPDRFLPENAEGRHPYAYLPFSGGLRNCIGQRFAMFEMKVVLAFILRRYKIEVKPQTFEELKPIGQLVMRPKDGMMVKLTTRD